MKERTKPKGITLWLVLMMLCATVQPAMAWGGLTHYSIDRDADKDSYEELSAANAPDAFAIREEDEDLYHFAHSEVSDQVLYGPLDYLLIFVVDNDTQERWGTGWMTHITADRSAHGHSTYYPVDDDDCYYEAAGGEYVVSAFGGDVLSYWYHEGYCPLSVTVHQHQLEEAFENYDSTHSTNYADDYDPDQYLVDHTSLIVITVADQAAIVAGGKPLLAWAYYAYHEEYDTYYPQAVEDVGNMDSCVSSRLSLPLYGSSASLNVSDTEEEHATMVKIRMEVGRRLIDEGLLIPHKEVDTETGDVTISIEQTVGNEELVKAYKQHLGESTERHTGEKSAIVEVLDDNMSITIDDIKRDHPDLYQKLTENGWVNETGELVEKRPHDR